MPIQILPQNNRPYYGLKPQNQMFCGRLRMDFAQELDRFVSTNQPQEPPLTLLKKLKIALPQLRKQENLIGQGHHGKVYRINNDFVLKIIPETVERYSHAPIPKDIKLQTYFGKPVLDLGNIKIMRNASTTENATYAGVPLKYNDEQKILYCRNITLPIFARLPQEAFDALAEDFKTLQRAGRSFDTLNPHNFIADGNKIKVVDELEYPDEQFQNTLSGMFKALINRYDTKNKAAFDTFAVGMRRAILEKIFIAGEKVDLPYSNTVTETAEIEKSLLLSNIYVPWSEVKKDLALIRQQTPNIKERMEKISEYFRNIDELNYEYFMR